MRVWVLAFRPASILTRHDVVQALAAQRHDVEILTVLTSDAEPQEQHDGYMLTRLDLDPSPHRLARRVIRCGARAHERWTWLERDVPIARVRLAAGRVGVVARRVLRRAARPGAARALAAVAHRCTVPFAVLEFAVRLRVLAAFGGADEYRSLDAGARPATVVLRWSARRASWRTRS